MAISTNGTVIARLAGGLYNTVMSNATYLEVAAQDPSTLANTLYARDFAKSTDLAVATTLVTNLGLSSVAGLNNWVAAQLTAAGSAKGAKIVSLLNDFAGMAADATYGAAATAFNTKVDAALASSQKTGSVEAKFADAGVVAVDNATFTLTTGIDKGASFTGGAGNDTFNATTLTLGATDVLAGGAGTDSLVVEDTAAVASLGGATISGIEKVTITSGAAVGGLPSSAGTDVTASAQETLTITPVTTTGVSTAIKVEINGTLYTGTASSTSAANIAAKIESIIDGVLGDVAGTSSAVVTVTSPIAGTPLPTITATAGTVAQTVTAGTANAIVTGTNAQKQVVAFNTSFASGSAYLATDTYTVTYNGVSTVFFPGVGATNASAASTIASIINTAAGSTVAVASGSTVTVTAPTAGTPLPLIYVAAGGASTQAAVSAVTVATPNVVALSSKSSGTAVAAPTDATDYTVSAGTTAYVSAAKTTKLTVSGTSIQTSGGLDVAPTGSGSIGVSAGNGAITIVTSKPTTGEVISNPGTGQTATYGSGVYVSGGTTVSVSQKGATVTSGTTNASSSHYTNTVQVGVDPTAAKDVGSGVFAGAVKSPTSNLFFNAVGGLAGDPTGDVTINASNSYTTGTYGKAAIAYGKTTAKVFTNGATTVSLTGVATGTVTDVNTTFVASSATDAVGAVAGTSKLATVNLTGISGTTTIKSDAINTVNVTDSTGSGAVTISNSGTTGANSGAFNLNVGNSTVSVTNATATSVNIGSTAATTKDTIDGTAPVLNTSTLTLYAAKATSLAFSNANSLTLTGTAGLAKVATITGSGAGNLTIDASNTTNYAKLVTVDASAKTGKVTLTLPATPAAAGQAITTGSGADKVTLAGSIGSTTATAGGLVTTTIALGAGNDAVVKGSSGAVTSGASIDGGDGVDTVDATLVTIGNAAIFKSFERLDLKGATDGGSFDATVFANSTIDGVKLNGALSATSVNTYAVTNLAGTTITADIAASTAANVTATLATSTGTADVMNINFATSTTLSGTPAATDKQTFTADGLTTTGIETVNVSSGGSLTNPVNFANSYQILNNLTSFTDNSNTTSSIVVTGAKEFTLGNLAITRDTTTTVVTAAPTQTADGIYQNATLDALDTATAHVAAALKTIDATATTGGVNIWAGVTDALTGSYNQKYDGLAISGGSGSDFIRNSAKLGVTTGGAGDDWLIVDGLTGSADGGAGNDMLITNLAKVATLTGGAGNDTFDVTLATQGATTSLASTDAAVASTADLLITTITDFAAGDTLKVAATSVTSAVMVNGTAAVASATSLFGAIDAALKATTSTTGITATVGTDVSVWFTYGGNTYIAVEKGATDGFSDGDVVVKLTGIHTLTAAAAPTVATGLFGEA